VSREGSSWVTSIACILAWVVLSALAALILVLLHGLLRALMGLLGIDSFVIRALDKVSLFVFAGGWVLWVGLLDGVLVAQRTEAQVVRTHSAISCDGTCPAESRLCIPARASGSGGLSESVWSMS
jgi:hypothetical protein